MSSWLKSITNFGVWTRLLLSFHALKEGVSMHEKTGDKFEPLAIFMTNFEIQNCQRTFSVFNARFRLQACLPLAGFDFQLKERSLFNEENLLKVIFFFKHNSFYTEPQLAYRSDFFIPIHPKIGG